MKLINRKILGLILARGGSKRLPNKNLKEIRGEPLIYYSIQAGLNSKYIDKVLVSTDDIKIKKVAILKGAEAPFLRPKRLALDETTSEQAAKHAIDFLAEVETYYPELIILLQPTSPLRNSEDVDRSVELFISSECEAVISVSKSLNDQTKQFKLDVDGFLQPIHVHNKNYVKDNYVPNGAIFIISTEAFCKYNSFYPEKIKAYIMPPEKSVDIDTFEDFSVAERRILKRG